MHAVIKTGGKQYWSGAGQKLPASVLSSVRRAKVTLDQVLFVGGDSSCIGQPLASGASVSAEIVGQVRGKKIVIFKFRRRKNYCRKTGHRQPYTELEDHRHPELSDPRPPRARREAHLTEFRR
ncbi:MAG: 50S ribosomal protein L21 [Polyangiaceae bacterium]